MCPALTSLPAWNTTYPFLPLCVSVTTTLSPATTSPLQRELSSLIDPVMLLSRTLIFMLCDSGFRRTPSILVSHRNFHTPSAGRRGFFPPCPCAKCDGAREPLIVQHNSNTGNA